MAESQRQDRSLSELVVREAVEKGMDSPLRETIVEAVEESEGGPSGARRVPLVGGLLGLGVAVGYLLGTRGESLRTSDLPIEPLEETEPVGQMLADEEAEEDTAPAEPDGAPSGRWGRRILLGLGLVAGIAIARRLRSSEEDEWEPIEEFETAVSPDEEDEATESESATEEAEAGEEVEAEAGEGAEDELEE